MTKRSKYVEAWRERAGHSSLPVAVEPPRALLVDDVVAEVGEIEVAAEVDFDQLTDGLETPSLEAESTPSAAAATTATPTERVRRCSKCGGTDHNARSCKVDLDKLSEDELERLTKPNGR